MSEAANHKTIAFSFDGTGNEPADVSGFTKDESISNVLKMHLLMGGSSEAGHSTTTTPSGEGQCTFYYSGIGTSRDEKQVNLVSRSFYRARRNFNMFWAPAWGDAGKILTEARRDLSDTYHRGDRVLVFGFSRGAALARKFIGEVLAAQECEEIAFLGVFDTVAALDGVHRSGEKISTDVVFENGTLDERVRRAVHILALDETRIPFTPTLINKDPKHPGRILEVWFPGVHSDVGGGYWLDGLSDIALEFMIRECEKALGDEVRIHKGDQASLHQLLENQGGRIRDIEVDDLLIYPMVHGALHSHSGLISRVGKERPRLVCVRVNDQPSKNPENVPVVHHSVSERFKQVSGYRPHSLRGLKFRLLLPSGNISEETITGIGGLLDHV